MAERETSDESTNTRAGAEKMLPGNLELPPPGPPVLISDTGIGIERKRREAREEWENARASSGVGIGRRWVGAGCGFGLQAGQLGVEHFGWELVAEAPAGEVVNGQEQAVERAGGQRGEVGGAGQEATQPADRIFHAALLPGGVGFAAEGFDAERAQFVVAHGTRRRCRS